MVKKPYIVPIPGSRKLERIRENLSAAHIRLSAQELQQLDTALDQLPLAEVFGGHSGK